MDWIICIGDVATAAGIVSAAIALYLIMKKRSRQVDELLGCPFCGCLSVNMEHDSKCFIGQLYPGDKNMNSNPNGYRKRCDNCGASTTWWHTKKQANKAWGQRVT